MARRGPPPAHTSTKLSTSGPGTREDNYEGLPLQGIRKDTPQIRLGASE